MCHVSQRHVEEGVRSIPEMGKKETAREGLQDLPVIPGMDKKPDWSYPNTPNMTSGAGFWQERLRPLFDKKAETWMIKEALKDWLLSLTSGGEETPGVCGEQTPIVRANDINPAYPAV